VHDAGHVGIGKLDTAGRLEFIGWAGHDEVTKGSPC
jgi:hypothetical protein